MARQGPWEILLVPAGKDAGQGTAGVNNPDPGPSPGLRGEGSAPQGEHEPRQALVEPVGENNKPKAIRGQEVVAL